MRFARPETTIALSVFAVITMTTVAGCSGPEPAAEVNSATAGEFRILPAFPLAGNELGLAWADDAAGARSAVVASSDGSDGYEIIWSVNGNKIVRGLSMQSGYARRGDRVSVRLEGDPVDRERAFVVIGNSPPEIQGVSVSRSATDPNLAVAQFAAKDPDGDRLRHHFEWSIDGQLVSGHDTPSLPLDERSRGQEIAVRLSTSDGELAVSRSSTAARLENHAPQLRVGDMPRILEDGDRRWAELDLSATDADGDAVEIRVTSDHGAWNPATGVLSWDLAEGIEEFVVTVRATDPTGGSAERQVRLKR
jgi:hypothetical protein